MKRTMLKGFVASVLCAGLLAGCAGGASSNAASDASTADAANAADKIQVVCTTFPQYDWARNVIGANNDAIDLQLLVDDGTDLHSFQPSVEDMAAIADCDLLIYGGGESDQWVVDALNSSENEDRHVLNMMVALGDQVRPEEVVEGMQAEDEHDHDHADADDADADDHADEAEDHADAAHTGEVENDEHTWLSLSFAKELTEDIAEELSDLDSANAATYKKNAEAYEQKLDELDDKYAQTVADSSTKTLVFADRFPFRYMVDDYDLSYYAAFVGCSAETEASFETVAFLAKKLDELDLKSVIVLENSDQKIAETVIDNTTDKDQKILTMDSMQAVTDKDIEGGYTYASAMESNLDVLKEALD